MQYPTPAQRETATLFAQGCKDAGRNLKDEHDRATRQFGKFRSEKIKGHYQAVAEALAVLIEAELVANHPDFQL